MPRTVSARPFLAQGFAFAVLLFGAAGAAGASPPLGTYECYSNGTPAPGLNVTLVDGSTYTDADSGKGSYTFDAGSSVVTFSGAGADGQRALYRDGNPPTLTYNNPRTGDFNLGVPCDHVN